MVPFAGNARPSKTLHAHVPTRGLIIKGIEIWIREELGMDRKTERARKNREKSISDQ
jgi:hypothetical protein